MKNRIKLWRIERASGKGKVFLVCKLLGVTIGDKTQAQLVKALAKAHQELMDQTIRGKK
jgi:hypothetical protein